ncbi:MAG: prealbumin-like fold domain-containing protein, partial [Actinomycetia bacterium]|nr:prealbumin-like fold domain-containing protein [Actinomycetes bacterium]
NPVAPYVGDPQVAATAIRDGNWDSVAGRQTWLTGSSAQLPDSMYLACKPAFFPDRDQWPWVDPSTGTTHTLPAVARLDAGSPNLVPYGSGACSPAAPDALLHNTPVSNSYRDTPSWIGAQDIDPYDSVSGNGAGAIATDAPVAAQQRLAVVIPAGSGISIISVAGNNSVFQSVTNDFNGLGDTLYLLAGSTASPSSGAGARVTFGGMAPGTYEYHTYSGFTDTEPSDGGASCAASGGTQVTDSTGIIGPVGTPRTLCQATETIVVNAAGGLTIRLSQLGPDSAGEWVNQPGSAWQVLRDDAGAPGVPDGAVTITPVPGQVGQFEITLPAGTWWLDQTSAAPGFRPLAAPAQFTVDSTGAVTLGPGAAGEISATAGAGTGAAWWVITVKSDTAPTPTGTPTSTGSLTPTGSSTSTGSPTPTSNATRTGTPTPASHATSARSSTAAKNGAPAKRATPGAAINPPTKASARAAAIPAGLAAAADGRDLTRLVVLGSAGALLLCVLALLLIRRSAPPLPGGPARGRTH